jgi:O-antigen/teichoic acid export membrane protein
VATLLGMLRSAGARAGLLVLGCSLVGHVANYAYYVLAARALSPAQFSDVSAMTALATITFMPASGVQAAAARDTAAYLAVGDQDKADGLTRWLAHRVALVQIGALAVLVLATPAAVSALGLSSRSVWLAGALWLVLGIALQVSVGPLQGHQRFGAVGAVLAGPLGALRPLLLLPCVALAGLSGALTAMVIATIAGLLGVGWALRRPLTNRRVRRVALTGLLPALTALMAFASLTNTDVLAAKTLLSAHAAGLYASAALLGKIALYAPSALALVLLPKVTVRLERGQDVRGPALLTMAATVGTGVVVTAAIMAAPSSVVNLVFGSEYRAGFWLAAPIAAVMTLNALLQVHVMMALAAGERATIWIVVGATVVQIVGLATLARSAGTVVAMTAVATGGAILAHELLSDYGMVKLLLRGRPQGSAAHPLLDMPADRAEVVDAA